MNQEEQARLLAEWLDRPGESPPDDLDTDVVEAMIALRPELAPPPRVAADDILALVEAGPLAPDGGAAADAESTGEVMPFPGGASSPEEQPSGEAPAGSPARPGRRPWLKVLLGGGAAGGLAVAATALLALSVTLQSPMDAPDALIEADQEPPAIGSAPASHEMANEGGEAAPTELKEMEEADEPSDPTSDGVAQPPSRDSVGQRTPPRSTPAARPTPQPAPRPRPQPAPTPTPAPVTTTADLASKDARSRGDAAAGPSAGLSADDAADLDALGYVEAESQTRSPASAEARREADREQAQARATRERAKPTEAKREEAVQTIPELAGDAPTTEAMPEAEPEAPVASADPPAMPSSGAVREPSDENVEDKAERAETLSEKGGGGLFGGGDGLFKKKKSKPSRNEAPASQVPAAPMEDTLVPSRPDISVGNGWKDGLDAPTIEAVEAARAEADALASQGKPQEAGDVLLAAMGGPTPASQFLALEAGRKYLMAGDTDQATTAAQRGLALGGAGVLRQALWVLLGDARQRAGDSAGAEDAWARARSGE